VAHRHRSFGFDYDVRSKGITCLHWILRAVKEALAIGVLATMGLLILYLAVQRLQRDGHLHQPGDLIRIGFAASDLA